jgi:hypothetical protein
MILRKNLIICNVILYFNFLNVIYDQFQPIIFIETIIIFTTSDNDITITYDIVIK